MVLFMRFDRIYGWKGLIMRIRFNLQQKLFLSILVSVVFTAIAMGMFSSKLVALLVVFVGLSVSLWIAHETLKPLALITRVSRDILSGRLNARIDIKSNDEFADLGVLFNEMTEQLDQSQSVLKKERDALSTVNQNIEALIEGAMADVHARRENPNLCKCWEVKKCDKKECPSYHASNLRCWSVSGTFCGGVAQGEFAKKYGNCEKCDVYKHAVKDPVFAISEKFNSLMDLLDARANELRVAAKKMEHAYNVKGQFLANMSHEIRTPMNVVLGYASLLAKTPLSEKQLRHVKLITSGGELLLGVINDILDVTKFESGKVMLEVIEFKLDYLCRDVFYMIQSRLINTDINTFIKIAPDVPLRLKGDPTRLRQVLMNLLGNAVKFTKKGEIGISIFKDDHSVEQGFVALRIEISDTGIGIPPGKREEIFEPFSQADISTTRQYGGTGLGLTICKAIVHAMGGDIHVESEEGKGSKFIFTTTFNVMEDSFISEIYTAELEQLKGKRVVIIDDRQQNCDILAQYCQDAGLVVSGIFYDSDGAYNGVSNLVKAGDVPDIILSDIMMPGVSGHDLAKRFRADQAIKGIKLVAITSDASIGSAKEAHDAGFNGYLTKPVIQDDLLKVIAVVLLNTRQVDEIVTRHIVEELRPSEVRILVAEDNMANQELMREYLNMLNVTCDFVSNGQEAIDKLKQNKYNLCFMDVQMPVMDGLTATRIIREQISKDFPVIALSAAVLTEDRKRGEAAGMNDYVNKPVDFQTLKEMIIKWKKEV